MKSMLKVPGTQRLKLTCDKPLSIFAFKFKLRRFNVVSKVAKATVPMAGRARYF
jgi:hypothetical protein